MASKKRNSSASDSGSSVQIKVHDVDASADDDADPTILFRNVSTIQLQGFVIIKAAWDGSLKLLKTLVEGGTDVDSTNDDGQTPLIAACMNANQDEEVTLQMIRFLFGRGAQINLQDRFGRTALMYSCALGRPVDITKCLLDFGANLFLEDRVGFTSLVYAYNSSNGELEKVLRKHCKRNGREMVVLETRVDSNFLSYLKIQQKLGVSENSIRVAGLDVPKKNGRIAGIPDKLSWMFRRKTSDVGVMGNYGTDGAAGNGSGADVGHLSVNPASAKSARSLSISAIDYDVAHSRRKSSTGIIPSSLVPSLSQLATRVPEHNKTQPSPQTKNGPRNDVGASTMADPNTSTQQPEPAVLTRQTKPDILIDTAKPKAQTKLSNPKPEVGEVKSAVYCSRCQNEILNEQLIADLSKSAGPMGNEARQLDSLSSSFDKGEAGSKKPAEAARAPEIRGPSLLPQISSPESLRAKRKQVLRASATSLDSFELYGSIISALVRSDSTGTFPKSSKQMASLCAGSISNSTPNMAGSRVFVKSCSAEESTAGNGEIESLPLVTRQSGVPMKPAILPGGGCGDTGSQTSARNTAAVNYSAFHYQL